MKNGLKITKIRSEIGKPEKQRRILKALGLRRMNHSVVHANSPVIRGMIAKIPHLVAWEEIDLEIRQESK